MAISVSFTTAQVLGAPSEIVLTDTSTGSDVTATSRRVYIQNSLGEYVTESGATTAVAYTSWPIADGNSITLEVLTQDAALDITVMYVNNAGTSVAQTTELCGFTLYNETAYYALTQAQASQNSPPPTIIQDSQYYLNKLILRTEIDSGNNAITYGDDIVSAQNAYNRATYLISNENLFF